MVRDMVRGHLVRRASDLLKVLLSDDWADRFAARYGGPVYLVGSALERVWVSDLDIRIVLDESDLYRLYGPQETRLYWQCYDRLKQSRRLSRRVGCFVDLKVLSHDEQARYATRPRRRLDSWPDSFWYAGVVDG